MPKIRNHDKVRFVRGQTVDTGHVEGGDLKGCTGTVVSEPFKANGKDGPKGQLRVAVAVDPDKAPRFAGFLTVPVANLERRTTANRRAMASGMDFGRKKRGVRAGRTKYRSRGGKLVKK